MYKRLRGNVLPIFTIKLPDEQTPVDFADSLKAYELSDGVRDDVTFAEVAAGDTAEYIFKVKIVVSFATAALYGWMWTHPGAEVDIIFGPWGNAVASDEKPHFTFTAQIPAAPGLSMEAAAQAKTGAEIERELTVLGPVTLVTGP